MDGEQIARLRLANPFRPFTLITSDGARLPVTRPYSLAITRNRSTIVYEASDGNQLLLDAAVISSVEVDETAGRCGRGLPA